MALLRRSSREVYRVYSEAEYLAGADDFGEWQESRSTRAPQRRPLRRLGAAAALTGALGALGGVIVFAGIGARSANRLLAVNGMSGKRGAPPRPGEVDSASSAGRDRVRPTARVRHTPLAARRGVGSSARRGRAVSARTAHSASPERASEGAPGVPAEPVGGLPAVAYDATRADPGEGAAKSPTQREFGFER